MPSISEKKTEAAPGFVFLGEHPALDFANTRLAPQGELVDLLETWADVIGWFGQTGLSTDPELALPGEKGEVALAAVRHLRQSWFEELPRLIEQGSVSDAFLGTLNAALDRDVVRESLERGPAGISLIRQASPLRGGELALAILARQIADFVVRGNPAYVRRCANAACVLHFYDTTKNHRRQWCSGALCGNRHKVAAFRRRRAKVGE